MGPEIISHIGGFPFLSGPLERSSTVYLPHGKICDGLDVAILVTFSMDVCLWTESDVNIVRLPSLVLVIAHLG